MPDSSFILLVKSGFVLYCIFMDPQMNSSRKIRIGILGPRDSVEKILSAVSLYSDIEFNSYEKEEVVDAPDAFDLCQEENDAVFFSGVAVMEEVRKNKLISKPYDYIPRSGYSLVSAIWEMTQKSLPYKRVSIDVVPDQVLQEVSEEFNLSFDKIYTMPFSPEYPESAYEKQHRSLIRRKKVDVILTGFGSIYSHLKQDGLPAVRLYPSVIQIRQHLDQLINHIRTQDFRSAGIALQIIRIKGIKHDSLGNYNDLEKRGKFYIELLPYVKGVQGSLFAFGREEMIIYSTRGEIEAEGNRRLLRDLVCWSEQSNLHFYSGIGFGTTAYEAEKSARKALANAKELPASGAYIVDDDQIKGPICEAEELDYFIKVADPVVLKISEKTGLSAAYISKIQAAISRSGKDSFDSDELSQLLNTGERTARRILKKLQDSGMGEVVAKENRLLRGRPKNIIRITFPN